MASIAGESIFGPSRASREQAHRQALLVKAAKVGIKAHKMRLLEPDSETPSAATTTRASSRSVCCERSGGGSSDPSERALRATPDREDREGKVVAGATKKRRKARLSSRAGAVASVPVGGLAAIADLYN